jgi:hypothetical protein
MMDDGYGTRDFNRKGASLERDYSDIGGIYAAGGVCLTLFWRLSVPLATRGD